MVFSAFVNYFYNAQYSTTFIGMSFVIILLLKLFAQDLKFLNTLSWSSFRIDTWQ